MELKNIISSSFIIPYLESKLSNYRYYRGGQEFVCNSVFYEDSGRHMSINVNSGRWQDFKLGIGGNFVKLYAKLENLSYQQAEVKLILSGVLTLDTQTSIPNLKVANSITNEKYLKEFESFKKVSIEITPMTTLEELCWMMIYERKLYPAQFFCQEEGVLSGRLIVPFVNSKNQVYFWQARSLLGQKPKYIMPSSDFGIKASEILYPYKEEEDYVVITEGPIDAFSLQLQGVNATCTIGSHISEVQMKQLSEFKGQLILGYDRDEAGIQGIRNFNKQRKKFFIQNFHICLPSKEFKDWNEMHAKDINLKDYITKNVEDFNELQLLNF